MAASTTARGRPGRRPRSNWRDPWRLAGLAALLILLIFIVYPQLWIVRAAFTDDAGAFTLARFGAFVTDARFTEPLVHSVVVSLSVGAGAALVAVPFAFVMARYRIPGRQGLLTMLTMATTSPPFLGAYAWLLLLGSGGIITRAAREAGLPLPFESILGVGGIIWVGVWFTFALIFLMVYDALRAVDPALEEAAASVGSTPWRTHWRVTLPLAVPAIATGCYLAAMRIFADFGTPMLIGGGYSMLPVVVYQNFMSEVAASPGVAATASLMMVLVSGLALVAQRRIVARRSFAVTGGRDQPLRELRRGPRALVLIGVWTALLLGFVPHLVVLLTSFLRWQSGILQWEPTLENYRRLFEESLQPIVLSFVFAGIACLMALVMGVVVAYIVARKRFRVSGPLLNNLVMVPYILPGTVFAIGFILAFNHLPVILTGTALIIVVAYFIRRLPYVMKSIEAALGQVHPSLEEAAMSVGAPPRRSFRDIVVPIIRPAVISGGTVGFLQMITELSATVMLYAVPWVTMTVVIFTNAMQPGSPFGVASAMTTVLLVSVYVPLYLLRRRYKTVSL
ncbi:iron ABC transporter permease [Nonomuraea longispora]|uniref:Iron ABC transporter permease n=1 Tax=Nonomuraea longispora TaxID=1848320 RepID=A0A4R4N0E3_9ACTN|nr:iron ABC transporter permease [Nonomuraea longispora]TDC02005.1 iron ABC transporter permease [Nonomuraea longispora]